MNKTTVPSILAEMYSTAEAPAQQDAALEKTAEEQFEAGLFTDEDFSSLSDDDLAALEADLVQEIASSDPESEEALDKLASEDLMGRTALHSFLQEEKLIKLALAQGLCRICKENPLEPDSHPTICPGCLEG